MTLAQIEKTREFLKNIDKVSNLPEMERFSSEIIGFYGKEFLLSLKVKVFNTVNSYITIYLEKDKATIKSFLESQLAEDDKYKMVFDVLELIEEGQTIKKDERSIAKFISKVFYSYSGKIKFDKTTEAVATAPKDIFSVGMLSVDENMLNGVFKKLKDYAVEICSQKQSSEKTSPMFQITNNNMVNTTASVNVDISISIDQARKQVDAAGLADDQYQAVMDKLNEIEEIANSKDNKGKRWQKAKDILKWVAEQGITVAGIVLPLLAPMIGA